MMLKLGTKVKDRTTGLTGMLVNLNIDVGRNRNYNFQPRGLNPKTGEPVEKFWLSPDRVIGGELVTDAELPYSVLGTAAEDSASGFKGEVIGIMLFVSGCVHLEIKPKGVVKETGAAIGTYSFDIRQCVGPAIKKLSAEEVEKDKQEKPSPFPVTQPGPGKF